MLADLFDDPNNSGGKSYKNSNQGLPLPPAKRKDVNLCGIINQGATCYLNTLIQTLFYTKEFRGLFITHIYHLKLKFQSFINITENLFSLTPEELGLRPQENGQQGKQRIILIELQRLFAQLSLLDQDACSTNKLTDSFGWSNNEELQQHDVQELNRILFSAIEQSLVNTKQAKLIQELYRGTYVNKIKCLSCLNIGEREVS
jgi:ubiquitin carboxyl-terminal hydrolase 40